MVASCIAELVLESQTIIIPQLGALTLNPGTNNSVFFNKYIKFDDGKLVNYVAEKLDNDLEAAKEQVKDFVASVNALDGDGTGVPIGTLGSFYRTAADIIDFTAEAKIPVASETVIAIPEADLTAEPEPEPIPEPEQEPIPEPEPEPTPEPEPKPIPEPEPEPTPEPEPIPEPEPEPTPAPEPEPTPAPEPEPTPEPEPEPTPAPKPKPVAKPEPTPEPQPEPEEEGEKKKRFPIWIIIVIVILLAGGGVGAWKWDTVSTWLGGEPAVVDTTAAHNNAPDETQDTPDEQPEEAPEEIPVDTLTNEEDTTSFEDTPEEVIDTPVEDPVEDDPVADEPAVTAPGGSYHIIRGAYGYLNNAENLVLTLKDEGYSNASIAWEKDGKHFVSYGSYPTRGDADAALQDIKDKGKKGRIVKH